VWGILVVIGSSGGAAAGAFASGFVVAPASSHKLQSESLEKQKSGWKTPGVGGVFSYFLGYLWKLLNYLICCS